MRVLAVAEKPSVAKEIGHVLSHGTANSNAGPSAYNRVFTFNAPYPPQAPRANATFAVTSVTGHLMELDFAESHRGWSKCDPVELFTAPIERTVPEEKRPVQQNLEQQARAANELHLWLDCDREGEAIAYEVIAVCTQANPRLVVRRARFSTLIPRDIFHALNNLVSPDERLANAVNVRSELDLRLGAAFTRLQTFTLEKRYEGLDGVVSYGPCQFPTMWFVVERARRIASFRQEAFWHIELVHDKGAGAGAAEGLEGHPPAPPRAGGAGGDGVARFSWARNRLFDRLTATILYEICTERKVATVISSSGREKRRWRPTPLATVELQKMASQHLRISSDQTMEIAEKLYTDGYMSYPRTETDKFKEGTDLRGIIQLQADHRDWGGFAQQLLGGEFAWPRDGGHDDGAHPPIHPCKASNGLTGDALRVYELVARRFLACCAQDAIGHESVVKVELAGERFSASGLMISARNYLDVYKYEQWRAKTIPHYVDGERFEPTIKLVEGATTAPQPLSESDLISLMDEHGIGTDATIADHIKKVIDRGYAEKRSGIHFYPLPLGRALLKGYQQVGFDLGKPHLRAEMERNASAVASGQMSTQDAIDRTLTTMRPLYVAASSNTRHLISAADEEFRRVDCPACAAGDLNLRQDASATAQSRRHLPKPELREATPQLRIQAAVS